MTGDVYDLAVVGSAFGGSLIAMIARQLGHSVVMVERGRHPRFAIGESSTPLTNLLLEQLADTYDLPEVRAFSKWGSWRRTHPGVACGLKRGFTFYHHAFDHVWTPLPDRENELLVAASPNDEIADTHWYRPDFDAFLVGKAAALGVTYLDETELQEFAESEEGIRLTGTRLGKPVELRARFLVDASGPRGFLWRLLGLRESGFPGYPATEALFNHFTGVERWEKLHPSTGTPPYPPDDAALHHTFPGGWMWVLRFNNGITSAGVSVSHSLARELQLESSGAAWCRLLQRLPSVARQFRDARPIREFIHQPQMAFCCPEVTGNRHALLPSAAGFVDPLLSTGFPLTLLGIQRLAKLLEQGPVPSASELRTYSEATLADLAVVAELVGTLHRNLQRPAVFQLLGMLYFAAVSFAESARRLDRADRAPGFLLRGRPDFRRQIRELCAVAERETVALPEFARDVSRAIEPVNIAGLMRASKRNWYPADTTDLFAARDKLGVSAAEIRALLERYGLAAPF